MIQLLREVQTREWGRGRPFRVNLCHAAPSESDVFCAKELRELAALAGPKSLEIHFFLSRNPATEPKRLTPDAAFEKMGDVEGGFSVVICGTDEFVAQHKAFFEQRANKVYPL